ncbi:hypothetical protein [Comamonas testosteroni]|jgi:hypothetical protein|uniref:hypothetical protein n=1 Tax=Comamonas testosteroni TaxID=285 RepID=UPI00265EECAD|nr:hypothetical protein [Comamonas testosteroni]WKL15289.1 hypothetical protein QYQ99_23525 [Comamonas testosteroni]WQD41263.1 hypothetical protein U0024_15935 [Comamonas testosteroni]
MTCLLEFRQGDSAILSMTQDSSIDILKFNAPLLKIAIIRQLLRSNPCQLKIDFIKKIYLFTQLLSTATSSRKDDSCTGKAPPLRFKEAHTSDLFYPLARSVSAYILSYIRLIQHQSNAMKCQLAGPAASR